MSPEGSPKRRRGRATEVAVAEADALISLPPEVLDDILTRLYIRDAIRTSTLSRAWRGRWEALPSLDLNFPRPNDGAPEGLGAVDGILLRFPGRIGLFCADLDDTYACRIHDWLCVFSHRGIEILELSFSDGVPALPSSVFSCGRLTSLSLSSCSIPLLPPGFVAFPELMSLALKNVRLQEYGEDQIEEIIDTSPFLEHLDLTDVFIDGANVKEWVIRAPNLRHLSTCSENNDVWILKELTSLCYALISLSDFLVHRNFAKFLSGLVQVKKLLVDVCNVQSTDVIPEILLCTFQNLKTLEFLMHFCKQPPIMLTLCLLKNAPNLEKLEIVIFDEGKQEFEANGEFLNALWTDGMCANLQVVQMIGINWLPNEMSFIEFILSKARLLHTLSISHSEETVMSNEDALNELLRYKRASAEAQVLFKDSELCSHTLLKFSVALLSSGPSIYSDIHGLPPDIIYYPKVKLKTIRSETDFWALTETCGLWRRFYRPMQYFGLEMQHAENGFSRNLLLRSKAPDSTMTVLPTLLFVLVWYSVIFVVRKGIA